ncbi:MAG: TlpA family protein disulfide reductase [Planctomycetota bacterium]|nr:MAG: TlpA family protein disulfide reductase [Planctomycetota bacterium]
MLKQEKQIYLWLVVFISAIILAVVVIRAVVNQHHKHNYTEHEHSPSLFESFEKNAPGINQPKLSINNVIRAARSWGPVYTSWYGQKAPDFKLVDINGKEHRLSDYVGRDVMIIFWATWCGPCLIEIPHLIELRKTVEEDKLAMLAISYKTIMPPNTTKMVQRLVERQKINYTVFSVDINDMPVPYNQIKGIPSSFFIDREGKIKLATEGLLSLGAIKAILAAE